MKYCQYYLVFHVFLSDFLGFALVVAVVCCIKMAGVCMLKGGEGGDCMSFLVLPVILTFCLIFNECLII
jgi:hypothetical protein